MGGRAFVEKYGIESKRIPQEEYLDLTNKIYAILSSYFNKIHLIKSYHDKLDHGDADFLVSEPKSSNHRLDKEVLGAELIQNNQNITSYLINGFQVDIINTNRNYFTSSVFYYDYDPLGNLLGKLTHKFRMSLGYNGLYYTLRDNENTYKLGEIQISTDERRIIEFLGLDWERRKQGFNTQEEIFDYVISSKYFDARIFSFENMNHIARTRDKKRKSYNQFMSYIEPYKDKVYDWPLIEERLGLVNQCFPEVKLFEQINELKEKRRQAEELAEKFNGTLVIEWTGITGKALGQLLGEYKKNYHQLIKDESAENIKKHFLEWYKENNLTK